MREQLTLGLPGFEYDDLRSPTGLARLDAVFLDGLDTGLAARLRAQRESPVADPLALSQLLLDAAGPLEAFVASLFGVQRPLGALRDQAAAENEIAVFKKGWVQKRARRYRQPIDTRFAELDARISQRLGSGLDDRELSIARYATALESGDDEAAQRELTEWCVLALREAEGQRAVAGWAAFDLPDKVDPAQLVQIEPVENDPSRMQGPVAGRRRRDGFALTDGRMGARAVHDEINYCVYCHDHDGDFCSKGFPEKKKQPELGLKVNPLGEVMTGCPLEEKISEMHALKRDGRAIAALAVVMVDNPMVPATGHRICNDCMKACIYQKQDPVNIPQIETRVLTDVLALPWGVEIYDLLTRWNPLRAEQHTQAPYNGRRVLIAGMGPAGFTMAHHLTMAGCAVVGVDGLKIEPLPAEIVDAPVRDYSDLEEHLGERVMAGFGGVAEYGITVRWDKNFLKLIYLTLARRAAFSVYGGVRFGGTVMLDDAWAEGFDHVCIATGAGLPRVIPMGNSLARGMRQANDFLMALQLTGAAKADSLAHLQVRLPAVVIGGGLTAVDAATEAQAYYIQQVEKILGRYEALSASLGEAAARQRLDEENNGVLDEFIAHGRAVRAEREQAAREDRSVDFLPLIRAWGGVTIAYRRSLNESPAYLRNHEEVIKALEEGIYYAEALDPQRAELDEYGHVQALVFRRRERSEDGRWLEKWQEQTLPARAVFIAAGSSPNTIYESEHRGSFELDGRHFLPHVCHQDDLQPVDVAEHAKSPEFGPFTSYAKNGKTVSFIGDTHPVFNGSVVKAIASAKRSYPYVLKTLSSCEAGPDGAPDEPAQREFHAHIESLLSPRIERVDTSRAAVIEIWVRAPLAARNFKPGQFFRLQTFERGSEVLHGTRLQVPLQTASGAGVEGDRIRLMLLRYGANAQIAARLKPGDPVVLMGPTGAPADIPQGDNVLVVAGAWGAAVMLDLGMALREAGNRVLYLAAYGGANQLYAQDELEECADQIIWATGFGDPIAARRPQDRAVQEANVIDVINQIGDGRVETDFDLSKIDQVYVMGSTGLLKGLQKAFAGQLGERFPKDVHVTGTVGSPMQCMLKGVCGQCLQWQVDPDTGKRTRAVFTCSMQDQPLSWIDLDNLSARQSQNRLSEHLNGLWVSQLLSD